MPTLLLSMLLPALLTGQQPARARDLGIVPGALPPGPLNAITDVAGVRVGQTTVAWATRCAPASPRSCRTAATSFLERVPAAIHVGNGFGKLLGVTQVSELGELETPILLTCTLCVWRAADAMVDWLLAQPGMERRALDQSRRRRDQRRRASTTSARGRSAREDVRAALDGGRERAGRRRAASARAPGPSRSAGRAGSARRRACCRRRSAAGRWACWCRPTSAACCRCSARRSGARSAADAFTATRSSASGGDGSIMIVVATDAPLSRPQPRAGWRPARSLGLGAHRIGDVATARATT